jgi:hypothetical protein
VAQVQPEGGRLREIRTVVAEGDAFRRGIRIGEELRDLVQRSVEFYHRYLERRGVSSKTLQDILAPYVLASENAYPEWMGVLKGMSVGATIPTLELFAINAFEELEPLLQAPEGGQLFLQRKGGSTAPAPSGAAAGPQGGIERCASLSLRTAQESILLAHNEHWLAGDADNVAVIVDVPDGRVPIASPTVVCCLPAVGVNSHGGAQGIGSLTASDDRVGIPRVLVSRSSLEARYRDDAIGRATLAGRAGGYGHVFAFSDGDCFTIETTATDHRVLEGTGVHTNHYLSDLAELAPPASEGSSRRLARLEQLLAERPPSAPEDLMDLMRDHGSEPGPVCLHPDASEGDDAASVAFSMVADVTAGRMWVAPGNPCENEFAEIDLSRLRN